MKIIVPTPVTSTELDASNVPETAPAAYNAGTTYALGNQVSLITGTVAVVYESLQNGNTGNAPNLSPLFWQELSTTYETYAGGTSYNEGDMVIYGHKVYESLTAANTGNQPDISPSEWLDSGATNRYRMFDSVVNSQTTRYGTVDVDLELGVVVNAAAMFNLSGATAQLIMTDSVAGEVYNETVELIDYSEIIDWHTYLFSGLTQASKAVFLDLPAYPSAVITLIIDAGASMAAVGEAVFGSLKEIGHTRYGMSIGITDYSRKETDDFGNFVIVPRRFADRAEYDVIVDSNQTNRVKKILTTIRTTPAVFIGNEELEETIIYGFYKAWNIVLSGPSVSECSIEVEGLT